MYQFVDELSEFVLQIWTSMLVTEVDRATAVPAACMDVTACIEISGAWNGACILQMTHEGALCAASRMFGLDESDVGESEIIDAVGELANQIGGNLKAMLPEPCQLGLPSVTEGCDIAPHLKEAREVSRVDFSWEAGPLVVILVCSDDNIPKEEVS